MNPTETALLRRIEATYPQLDRWRLRAASVSKPQPGSSIDADDLIFPSWPLSLTTLTGLAAAAHHLHASRLLLDARELFPTVYSTLARAALVGASQALWVMVPASRDERRGNGLLLVADELHNLRKHADLDPVTSSDLPSGITVDEARQHPIQRAAEVDALLIQLGRVDRNGRALRLNTTRMIDDVLTRVQLSPVQKISLRATWGSGSGAAHARSWPMLSEMPRPTVAPPPGLRAEFKAGGDLKTVAEQYFGAHLLTQKAWAIWDQRAQPGT